MGGAARSMVARATCESGSRGLPAGVLSLLHALRVRGVLSLLHALRCRVGRVALLGVLGGLLLSGGVASAAGSTQQPLTLSQIAARSVAAKYGDLDSIWRIPNPVVTAGTTAGDVVVSHVLKGPSPKVGEVIDVTARRLLPWASVSRAVAKGLPLVGTALTIAELAEGIRCRESTGPLGFECDYGTDEVQSYSNCWRPSSGPNMNGPGCWASGQSAAYDEQVRSCAAEAAGNGPSWSCVVTGPTSITADTPTGWCGYFHRQHYQNGNTSYSQSVPQCANGTQQLQTQCPAMVVNGVTIYPQKGIDLKCPTGVYEPASEDTVASRTETWGDKSKAVAAAGEAIANGIDMPEPQFPSFQTPTTIHGTRETITHPDGSVTVKDTRYDLTPTPIGYDWSPTTTTKDYPPGATIPPPGDDLGTGGTTSTGGQPDEEIITCGLPNTPPCKIDETGTPRAPADDSASRAQGFIQPILDCVLTPSSCLPALPDLNWSFSLPTSCAPIPVSGFGVWVESVDICPYQETIHDLMGMLWAAAGLFGAVQMMFRGSE